MKAYLRLKYNTNNVIGGQCLTLILLGLLLTSVFLLMMGCESSPTASGLLPKNIVASKHFHGSVSVNVMGDNKRTRMHAVFISSDVFSNAVVEALNRSALFSSVASVREDYRLEVQLVKVITPASGATMTVTVVSEWQLVRAQDSAVIADEYIAKPFSATVGDAFDGEKRISLAMAGSGRLNIAEGIRRLSELTLDK